MRFGFIGLGNIGRDIARDLVASGHPVSVYDVLPAAAAELVTLGAAAAGSPAEVAAAADIVGICVRDDKEVRDVIHGRNGLLAGAGPGLLIAVHSTVRIDTIKQLAREVATSGIALVDAPVTRPTNGPPRKGIVFMVSGAPDDVQRVRPYIDHCALKVIEAGPLGSAMALKICNNLLTYTTTVAANDAMNLAEAVGLDLSLLAEVTGSNGVASPNMLAAYKRRQAGDVNHVNDAATIERMGTISEKDLECALEVGRALNIELPATATARAHIRRAFAERFGKP